MSHPVRFSEVTLVPDLVSGLRACQQAVVAHKFSSRQRLLRFHFKQQLKVAVSTAITTVSKTLHTRLWRTIRPLLGRT